METCACSVIVGLQQHFFLGHLLSRLCSLFSSVQLIETLSLLFCMLATAHDSSSKGDAIEQRLLIQASPSDCKHLPLTQSSTSGVSSQHLLILAARCRQVVQDSCMACAPVVRLCGSLIMKPCDAYCMSKKASRSFGESSCESVQERVLGNA